MKKIVNQYLETVCNSKDGQFTVHENFWKRYEENKSKKLFGLFGEKIIIEKPIKIEKSIEQIVGALREARVRFDIRSAVDEEIKAFVGDLSYSQRDKYDFSDVVNTRQNRAIVHKVYYDVLISPYALGNQTFQQSYVFIHPKTEKVIKLQKGAKISKSLKHFISDKEQLDKVQTNYSKVLNDRHLEGILCLSIHPLDYLTASVNNSNWTSCYDTVSRGCWCASTLCLVNSPNTIIAYLKSNKDATYVGVEWNNKRWRTYVTLSESNEAIHIGRQYPYENEALEKATKEMVEELTGFKYNKESIEEEVVMQIETPYNMYNDAESGTISAYYTEEFYKHHADNNSQEEIYISAGATCPICGDLYEHCEAQLECESCGDSVSCDCCGDMARTEEARYIDGYGYICNSCIDNGDFSWCEHCEEYVCSDDIRYVHMRAANSSVTWEISVCTYCLDRNQSDYSYCEACDEWFESSLINENSHCENCAEEEEEDSEV